MSLLQDSRIDAYEYCLNTLLSEASFGFLLEWEAVPPWLGTLLMYNRANSRENSSSPKTIAAANEKTNYKFRGVALLLFRHVPVKNYQSRGTPYCV